MNTPHPCLEPDYHPHDEARATLARELRRHYSETADPEAPPFSLARLLLARVAGKMPAGREREVTTAAALQLNQADDPHRPWLPLNVLGSRSMATTPGAAGGYLVGTDAMAPVDVLRPWSVAAQAGLQVLPGLISNLGLPRVTSATTAGWVAEGQAPENYTDPELGNVSLTPRTALALVKFSVQLLRQGEAAEPFMRAMLLQAIGQLIDEGFFSGPGGVAPLGLLATPGTVAQSGSALARAGLTTMRKGVLNNGAREERLQWVGTPNAQDTLSNREAVADTASFLWSDAGTILGRPAHATPHAANGAANPLILGDFGTSVLGIFGPGVRLAIDPSQDFERAGLVMRVMLFADIVHTRPEAYAVAGDVS